MDVVTKFIQEVLYKVIQVSRITFDGLIKGDIMTQGHNCHPMRGNLTTDNNFIPGFNIADVDVQDQEAIGGLCGR